MQVKSNLNPLFMLAVTLLVFHVSSAYAAPTKGFPDLANTTILLTEEVERDDYSILVPSTTADGLLREVTLFSHLDTYSIRKKRYREAFVITMMQPALTQRLKADGHEWAIMRDITSTTAEINDGVGKLTSTLSLLTNGKVLFDNSHLSNSFSKISNKLGAVSVGLNIGADVMNDIFLHAIANALVLERLECLEQFMSHHYFNDPAARPGFFLAKQDVQQFLDEDFNVIQATLDSLKSLDYIGLSSYLPAIAQHFGYISSEMASSISVHVLPYYLGYNILVELRSDLEDIQTMCVAATLDSALLKWSWDQIDLLPDSSEPAFENARRILLTTVQMRYGIGYWYNKKYDDILALNVTSPLDWVQRLTQEITKQYSSVQDFRTDVLQNYMNRNYNNTIEINPYLSYSLQKPDIAPTTPVNLKIVSE